MNIETLNEIIEQHPYYSCNKEYLYAKSFYDFPILTKNDVLLHKDLFYRQGENLYIAYTSGSTGVPMKIIWNWSDYYQSIACLWRRRKTFNIGTTDFYLTCHNSMLVNGKVSVDPVILNKNFISLSKVLYTPELISEYIKYIRVFNPVWIYAQPSFVYQMGLFFKEKSPDLLTQFRYIELVGEMIDPTIKSAISGLFSNAQVVSMYGMQEFNCIMYEKDGALEECSENVRVEILNEEGKECGIDEEGDIVVTGLKNKIFPLVRYKTEDRGKKINVGGKIRYEITKGKANDSFTYNDRVYDGSIFFHVVLKYNLEYGSDILRFQVVQREKTLYFKLCGMKNLLSDFQVAKQIKEILNQEFSVDCDVEVEFVSDFTKFSSGVSKNKYFIRECGKEVSL